MKMRKKVAKWARTFLDAISGDAEPSRSAVAMADMDAWQRVNAWERTRVLSLSRDVFANIGWVRGAVLAMRRYSVGHGLRPQWQTGDEKWNQAAEAFWAEWCKIADTTGRHSFDELLGLACISIDVDGDCGFILGKTATGFPKIALIEGHRIGSGVGAGDEWRDGVRIDSLGRPVAYRILDGSGALRGNSFDVAAADFIHLLEATSASQYRGLPTITHGINDARDLRDVIALEKKGTKKSLATSLIDYRLDSDDSGLLGDGDLDGDGIPAEKLDGGLTLKRRVGEKVESLLPNRPTQGLSEFERLLVRSVALGMGLPPEFVYDPTLSRAASARMVAAQAQRRFAERQNLLIEKVLNRLAFWVVSLAVKRGDLPPVNDAYRIVWQRPPALTVDAGREAQANREDILLGLRTLAEDYGERGLDWRDALDQRAIEFAYARQIAEKMGVPVEAVLNMRLPGGR
jgi:capsid protein